MKSLHFKTEGNPQEISEKLQSGVGSLNGFVFNINSDNKNSITFNMRKRVLYGWYMIYHNWTIAKGKLLKTDAKNETTVEIIFKQHFLILFIIYSHFLLGLALIITLVLSRGSSISLYLPIVIFLTVGTIIWFAIQRKFKKDIKKYKILISEILRS